jgi:hypothetical protein
MMDVDDNEDLRGGDEGHYSYDMRVNDAEYTSCVNAG